MNIERAREFLLSLPDVVETEQWGGVVFWVGDKAIGGKMFCMMNLEAGVGKAISYAAGPERFYELCEREGIVPAPYMARIFWVATDEWGVLRDKEWAEELWAARAITWEKMPAKVKAMLELPAKELKALVGAQRKVIAAKEAAKKAGKKSHMSR